MTVYDMTFEARERYSREEGREEGRAEEREYIINKLADHYVKEGTAKTKDEALEMARSILE